MWIKQDHNTVSSTQTKNNLAFFFFPTLDFSLEGKKKDYVKTKMPLLINT